MGITCIIFLILLILLFNFLQRTRLLQSARIPHHYYTRIRNFLTSAYVDKCAPLSSSE